MSTVKVSTNFHYFLLYKLSFDQSKHSLNSTDSTTHTHTHTQILIYMSIDILTTGILSANILTTGILSNILTTGIV